MEENKKIELLLILRNAMNNPALKESDVFKKDQLDSFEKMNLLFLIEDICGKELSIIELFDCKTISDIINLFE